MANVNKVMLMGNITRDIDLRKTPSGTSVADIGLAVNRVRTDDQGGNRSKLKVVADNIQLIGSKGGSQGSQPDQHAPTSNVTVVADDDEPPF